MISCLLQYLQVNSISSDIQKVVVLDVIGKSCQALANVSTSESYELSGFDFSAFPCRLGTVQREFIRPTRVFTENRIGEVVNFVLPVLLGVPRRDSNLTTFHRRLWAIAQVLHNSSKFFYVTPPR